MSKPTPHYVCRLLAGMNTVAEMDGDMSGDDAAATLSRMIELAREALAAAREAQECEVRGGAYHD